MYGVCLNPVNSINKIKNKNEYHQIIVCYACLLRGT
jgi:hypothetical protein